MSDSDDIIEDLIVEDAIRWDTYYSLPNEELIEFTKNSRKPIINGIREFYEQHSTITPKQRLVLIRHLFYNDYGE